MKKRLIFGFIVLSFIGMVTFFVLDIFEMLHKGMAIGFIFGFVGTLLQILLHWKNNRFNALLQLLSSLIYAIAAVLWFIK